MAHHEATEPAEPGEVQPGSELTVTVAAYQEVQAASRDVRTLCSRAPRGSCSTWRSLAVGAAFGALGGKLGKSTIDKDFQEQVRAQVKPGTSALFMIVEQMTTNRALAELSKFGGTVIKTSLSKEQQDEIQEALHGTKG
jgi:hypothetical protein